MPPILDEIEFTSSLTTTKTSSLDPNLILILLIGALFLAIYFWYKSQLNEVLKRCECGHAGKGGLKDEWGLLKDKTVLITGGNEGIGAELAKDLARRGARIVLLCRDTEKAKLISESVIAENPTAQVSIQHIDLASLTSVRICASEILQTERRIDALIHCASVAYIQRHTKSIDGNELHLATNYFGPFLLNSLLMDRMKQTAKQFGSTVKVIHLGSCIHRIGKIHLQELSLNEKLYSPVKAYAQSKLAIILANREWARKCKADQINFYTLDPGAFTWTSSPHYDQLPVVIGYFIAIAKFLFGHSAKQVVVNIFRLLASSEQVDSQTGYYYRGGERVKPATQAMDDKMATSLWAETIKMCNIEASA